MAHRILSINRQSGSGGSYIGAMVAEKLGIYCYNRQLLDRTIELGGLDQVKIADLQQIRGSNKPDLEFYGRYMEDKNYKKEDPKMLKESFEKQKEMILKIAQQEDAVIVGRCAGWILRDVEDVNLLTVGIVGMPETRVKRVMENSTMNEMQAKRFIRRTDKGRFDYYFSMTGERWDGYERYDMVLNSGRLGLDECVDLLYNCF